MRRRAGAVNQRAAAGGGSASSKRSLLSPFLHAFHELQHAAYSHAGAPPQSNLAVREPGHPAATAPNSHCHGHAAVCLLVWLFGGRPLHAFAPGPLVARRLALCHPGTMLSLSGCEPIDAQTRLPPPHLNPWGRMRY